MSNWEIIVLWLVASLGGIGAGILGYAMNKKADPTVKFKLEDFIITAGIAVVSGGVWTLASWKDLGFSAVTIITGFIFGGGLDYYVKKGVSAVKAS